MEKIIRIKLPIEPTPQSRPKVVFKEGKTWSYYSPKTVQGREEFTACVKPHIDKIFPPHTPLRLTISFYRSRSKWVGSKESFPVRKPDLNNLLSLALDCMSGILYPDDAQVTKVIMKKRWAAGGNWRESGYIEIEIVEDKLTPNEKADCEAWQRDKQKIPQWNKKIENQKKKRRRKKKVMEEVER